MINHINPQFQRKNIQVLDGIWDFCLDRENIGDKENYRFGFKKQYDIKVPFSYTCEASLVNIDKQVDIIWYQRKITIDKEDLAQDLYLCFEGADDVATIYLNGHLVGRHEGGNSSFKVLLNDEIKLGENLLVIKVEDDFSISKGRGKQRWQDHNYGCWYTPTSGLYRSIYLEKVSHTHLDYFKITPNMNEANIYFDYVLVNFRKDLEIELVISYEGKIVNKIKQKANFDSGRLVVDLNSDVVDYQVIFWAPHDPHLYDLKINLICENEIIDEVESYFGMCEYRASGSNLLLNGFSYISKMVLYQGYSKDGLLTPKNDEEIIADIKNIKALGFNGIRCHQYIPSERFLYLCDLLGLSVWIEYPSPHLFNLKAQDRIIKEWTSIIKTKCNHPSIFAYVIYNESWGIRGVSTNNEEQKFVLSLYQLTKSMDIKRIVVSNDGWEHVDSDITTLHNYCQNADILKEMFAGKENLYHHRDNFAKGYSKNAPIFLTEYGGCCIGKLPDDGQSWGYGKEAKNLEDFYIRFAEFQQMLKDTGFKGYCYTQYKDVQQEKNGFVDENGQLKVDPNRIREIIENIY